MKRLEIFERVRSYVRHRRRQEIMDELTMMIDKSHWNSWLVKSSNNRWLKGIADEAVHFWLLHKDTTQIWLLPYGKNMSFSDSVIRSKLTKGLFIVYTPEMLEKGVDYIMEDFIDRDWWTESPDEENPFNYTLAWFGERILVVPERLRDKVQHIHVICIYDKDTESTAVKVTELVENAIHPTKEEKIIYEFID